MRKMISAVVAVAAVSVVGLLVLLAVYGPGPGPRALEARDYNACLDKWEGFTRKCIESCDDEPAFCARHCDHSYMISRTCFPPQGVRMGQRPGAN